MTLLQSIILGVVQGLTEFLPVSSSAHLALARRLLQVQESHLYFDLVCHGGTLLALILFLRNEVLATLKDFKMLALLFLALLPLIPGYFLLKTEAASSSHFGFFLMCTGIFLFFASRKKGYSNGDINFKNVLCIGIMQTLSLIPGISRSGTTIGIARLLGWDWLFSAKFSFLLAIPAILGGVVLETAKVFKAPIQIPLSILTAGFLTSFVVGLVSVRMVFWIYEKGKIWPFACYCFLMGILLGVYG